MGIMDMLPVN